MRRDKVYRLLSGFFFISTIAFAGGANGVGGGDIKPIEYGSAWFLGTDKTIQVCYEVSPSFTASKEEIGKSIAIGFATWKKYFQEKILSPALFNLTFNYVLFSNCHGNEDLKFLMGTTSQEIEEAKKEFVNPIAFSHRKQYSLDEGWGNGFIWIKDKWEEPGKKITWNTPQVLSGIIIHELGHVFGCEHVEGTIMTENIVDLLSRPKFPLTEVDEGRALLLGWKAPLTIRGEITQEPFPRKAEIEKKAYQRFIGRNPVGPISVRLNYFPKGKTELELKDDKSTEKLVLEEMIQGSFFESSIKIFKTVRYSESNSGKIPTVGWIGGAPGTFLHTSLKDVKGQKTLVLWVRNSDKGFSHLSYYDNGRFEDLFSMKK